MIAFKYRACTEKSGICRDIEMLLADQIYASPISQLNDCFEGTYFDNVENQLNEIEALHQYDLKSIKNQWQDLRETVEGVGIYSMSLSDVDYPNNKLLWSLYAGEYKGFCIAYDIDKLVQNEQFPWLVNRVTVQYQKSAPVVDVIDFSSETKLLLKMLGTKCLDWEHEKEFRLVYDKPGIKIYNRAALKAIYLGSKMSDVNKQRIVKGLQGRNVAIYEMSPMASSYDFKFDLQYSLRHKIENELKEDEYEIMDTCHRPKIENFYVLYKGVEQSDEQLLKFVNKFREIHATMDANVELYDSDVVKPYLKKYPLNDEEIKIMKEHSIGISTFDAPNIFLKDVFD